MKKVTVKNIEFKLFGEVDISSLVINPVIVTDTVKISINGTWRDILTVMSEREWDEKYGIKINVTATLAGVTITNTPLVTNGAFLEGGTEIMVKYVLDYVIPNHRNGEWLDGLKTETVEVFKTVTPFHLSQLLNGALYPRLTIGRDHRIPSIRL